MQDKYLNEILAVPSRSLQFCEEVRRVLKNINGKLFSKYSEMY